MQVRRPANSGFCPCCLPGWILHAFAVALCVAGGAVASPDDPCLGRDACYAPPPGSGVIDVKTFGARGDGLADDTQALRAALTAAGETGGTWSRFVYLPPGTYKVTNTIEKRDAGGEFDSGFLLRGAGPSHTVIRLADLAPNFDDPAHPRAVLFTSSHLWEQGGPYGGGKDWPGKGEGNQAFQNTIEGLTVDVGSGNRAAIALDYLGNNACAVRDVWLRDADGTAATGLSMTRKWPGPCLIENLHVQGFDIGIDVARSIYSLTLLDVSLDTPRRVGLRNNANVLSIARLSGSFPALAVENRSPEGMILLAGARLIGTSGSAIAFRNRGILRVSELRAEGFADIGLSPLPGPDEDAVFDGSKGLASSDAPPRVPAMPALPDVSLTDWVSVETYGAIPSDDRDDTKAIQAAFDSGAVGVYFPFGTYDVSDTLHPGPATHRIAGMNAQIRAPVRGDDTPVLATQAVTDTLTIDSLRVAFSPLKPGGSSGTWIRHDGPGTLILRDVFENALGYPSTILHRSAEAGEAHLFDVCCGRLVLEGPVPVVAYHFNTEGPGNRILNHGADLLVLGIKTENIAEVVRTEAGGRTQILGGLLYPVRAVPPGQAAFVVADGAMSAMVADRSIHANQSYGILIASDNGRTLVPSCGTRSMTLGIRWFSGSDNAAAAETICR